MALLLDEIRVGGEYQALQIGDNYTDFNKDIWVDALVKVEALSCGVVICQILVHKDGKRNDMPEGSRFAFLPSQLDVKPD